MGEVKPFLARRSATAAPIPREAPVTIATLLDSFAISGLLMVSRLIRIRWEKARPFLLPDNHALSGIIIRELRTIGWTGSTRCGSSRGWWSDAVVRWPPRISACRAPR